MRELQEPLELAHDEHIGACLHNPSKTMCECRPCDGICSASGLQA